MSHWIYNHSMVVVGSHVSLYDGMKNECRPLDVTLSNGSISYRVKNLFFISSSRVNKNNEAGAKKGFLSGETQGTLCVH